MSNGTGDKRESPRRELKLQAILKVEDMMATKVRTLDIGKYGMALIGIARQLTTVQDVNVSFDMFFAGKLHHADLYGRISHCMNTKSDGYKAGLEFLSLDAEFESLLAKYVGA